MGILPLDQILENNQIDPVEWDEISSLPRFQQILEEQVSAWSSASNTYERVKLKAATALEDWLPELHARIHDRSESLPAKVEAGKLLAKLSGIGERSDSGAAAGERLQVTINLGADHQIKIEKDVTPPTIEGDLLG